MIVFVLLWKIRPIIRVFFLLGALPLLRVSSETGRFAKEGENENNIMSSSPHL